MAETVIIDIKVSNAEAVKNIEDATAAINELKLSEKSLKEQYDKQLITYDEYIKSLASIRSMRERNTQVLAANRKALKDNIKTEQEHSDSLNRMRQTLRQALGEYDKLSKAEREGAKGQEMLKHIQDLTDELNKAEQASGRFQRNVGNYESAIKNLPGKLNEWAVSLNNVEKSGGILNIMNQNAKGLGQTLKLLAKNPFFIILRVVIGLFTLLQTQVKKNDDAMTALQRVTAALKPVMDALRAVMEGIVKVLTSVATALTGVLTKLGQWLGLTKENIDANQELVQGLDALEDKERAYTVESAKRNRDVSELRAKAADSEKYSYKERIGFIDEAMKLEKQGLIAQKNIAREKLRLAELEQKQNKDESDEAKNRLAELETAMYQAEQTYNDGMRSLRKQRSSFIKQEEAEEKAQRKQRAEAAKAARTAELKERRAAQDAAIELIKNATEKEKMLLDIQHSRAIEDLRLRLKTEQNLTLAARKAIQEQMTLIDAKYAIERSEIDKRVQTKAAKAWMENQERLRKFESDQAAKYYEAQLLAAQNELNKRLQAVRDNAEETALIMQMEAQHELNIARAKQASILRINYKTEEEYQLALEQATAAVIEAQQKATKAAEDTAKAVEETKAATLSAQQELASAFGDIAGSFGELFKELASEDARYQDYATAMGYLQLLTSTAVSIATAIEGATKAAAATGPAAPFTLAAYIGEMVATVVGALAQAKSLMKQANERPTYATGGVIHGAGTGTSDSITARVSNGESILTAKATSMFYDQLSAMNVAGGGRPFDQRGGSRFARGGVVSTTAIMSGRQMQAMADMIADAVGQVQPIVSVREITNVQNQVKAKETIARQ